MTENKTIVTSVAIKEEYLKKNGPPQGQMWPDKEIHNKRSAQRIY